MHHKFAIETRNGSRGEDRASFFETSRGFVAVIADGAGGTGGGAEAATQFCDLAEEAANGPITSWASFLADADLVLSRSPSGGMTTVVVVEASNGFLVGASVGDSGALLFGQDTVIDLTASQKRKPLIGSGLAEVVPFGPIHFDGRLLLATDGILKYIPTDKIDDLVRRGSLISAALELIEAAKLPNGGFHDDVAVLLSEPCEWRANVTDASIEISPNARIVRLL
jgi:PPM family protein phosphatase